MKIAAFSMVRNECDIIELFIKINSRVFDRIYIADHNSTDATPVILKKLISAGYPVEYFHLDEIAYEQSAITTNFVRKIAELNLYDFICPIDADEFYCDDHPDQLKLILEQRRDNNVFLLPWKTYCPTSENFYKHPSPVYELFLPREFEPRQYYKIIIRNEFAKNCVVQMGNHSATHDSIDAQAVSIPYFVNHIPVRSSEQLVQKVIIGSHSFKLKSSRGEREGYHWDNLAHLVRSKNYLLDYETLRHCAITYATPADLELKPIDLLESAPRLGLPTDIIEFRDESRVSLVRSLDNFADQLIKMQTSFCSAPLNEQQEK